MPPAIIYRIFIWYYSSFAVPEIGDKDSRYSLLSGLKSGLKGETMKSLRNSAVVLAGLIVLCMLLSGKSPGFNGLQFTIDEQFRIIAENPSMYALPFFFAFFIAPLLVYNVLSLASFDSDWAPAFYGTVLSLFSLYLVCVTVSYASQALLFPRLLSERGGFDTLLLWYLGNHSGLAWFLHQTGYAALSVVMFLLFFRCDIDIPLFALIRRGMLFSSFLFFLGFIGMAFAINSLQLFPYGGMAVIFLVSVLEIISFYLRRQIKRRERQKQEAALDLALAGDAGNFVSEHASGPETRQSLQAKSEGGEDPRQGASTQVRVIKRASSQARGSDVKQTAKRSSKKKSVSGKPENKSNKKNEKRKK